VPRFRHNGITNATSVTRGGKPHSAGNDQPVEAKQTQFDLAIMIVISVMIVIAVVVVVMLVPPAMLSTVMMFIAVVISITIPIAVPITIPIAITVRVPIAVRGAVAAPSSGTPRSAASRCDPAIGSIRRDAIMPINVLHSTFHATHLALIVGGLVALPA
jgi:hypothetical protein